MVYQFENSRIVLADDMQPMLDLTKSVLNIFGFERIHTAVNGEEAFDLVCKHDPHLLITDWLMKPMDGLALTQKIRQSSVVPNPYVPILMMTGFSARLRVEEARDMGVTEFMVKPFSAHDLAKRVEQIIEKPRQFVDAEEFFGPDRRRRKDSNYKGPKRRDNDEEDEIKAENQMQTSIAQTLARLKEETKEN